MTVVAISQRLIENATYPETRDCLDVRWSQLCSRHGLLPLVLPTYGDPVTYLDTFRPGGVILTGGNDLSSVSSSPLSAVRDAFEHRLLDAALARSLPVLAVCRGMQLVADHFGVRVVKVADHPAGVRHAVTVDRATRFGELLGDVGEVNSFHDYAVMQPPAGFAAVARSADGVIEAMEHETLPIFCQMWHPEREAALSAGEAKLLRTLFGSKKEGT